MSAFTIARHAIHSHSLLLENFPWRWVTVLLLRVVPWDGLLGGCSAHRSNYSRQFATTWGRKNAVDYQCCLYSSRDLSILTFAGTAIVCHVRECHLLFISRGRRPTIRSSPFFPVAPVRSFPTSWIFWSYWIFMPSTVCRSCLMQLVGRMVLLHRLMCVRLSWGKSTILTLLRAAAWCYA